MEHVSGETISTFAKKCQLVVPFGPRPDGSYCGKQPYIKWSLLLSHFFW